MPERVTHAKEAASPPDTVRGEFADDHGPPAGRSRTPGIRVCSCELTFAHGSTAIERRDPRCEIHGDESRKPAEKENVR